MKNVPSREDVISAVNTIIKYVGDDPNREGLKDTAERVVRSYDELFGGYETNPADFLHAKFFEIAEYQDIILLENISFKSTCEHHMLPVVGTVDIAYIPNEFVVGISKLARVVEAFSRRLQIQEKMTAEIAEIISQKLSTKGVAVRVSAIHNCMTLRGVLQEASIMRTFHYTGSFKQDANLRQEFLNLLQK